MKFLKNISFAVFLALAWGPLPLAQTTPTDGPVSKSVNIADPYNSASEVESINVYGFVGVESNISFDVVWHQDTEGVVGGFNLADKTFNDNVATLSSSPQFTSANCNTALGIAPDDLAAPKAFYYLDEQSLNLTLKQADSSTECVMVQASTTGGEDMIFIGIRTGSQVDIKNYRGPDAQLRFMTTNNGLTSKYNTEVYDMSGTMISGSGQYVVDLRTDNATGSSTGIQVIHLLSNLWHVGATSATGIKNPSNETGLTSFSSTPHQLTYDIVGTNLYY